MEFNVRFLALVPKSITIFVCCVLFSKNLILFYSRAQCETRRKWTVLELSNIRNDGWHHFLIMCQSNTKHNFNLLEIIKEFV